MVIWSRICEKQWMIIFCIFISNEWYNVILNDIVVSAWSIDKKTNIHKPYITVIHKKIHSKKINKKQNEP